MKPTNATENKYSVYESNNYIYLNLGNIKKGEKQEAKIKFEDVTAKKFSISATCGCTTTSEETLDEKTVIAKIIFNGSSLPKTVIVQDGKNRKELKIIGNFIK